MIITATELKNNLGKYLELIRKNDSIIVTKNGVPIARLVPFAAERKANLDSLVGLAAGQELTLDEIKNGRLSKQ